MPEEKGYALRELKGDDAFLMIKIISKIGIKQLKECMESAGVKAAIMTAMNKEATEADKEAAMNSVGMVVMLEIASTVLEHLPECRNEIYDLLAQLSGKTRDEIADMKLIPLTKMIKDVFRKPEFTDFFGEVFELFS